MAAAAQELVSLYPRPVPSFSLLFSDPAWFLTVHATCSTCLSATQTSILALFASASALVTAHALQLTALDGCMLSSDHCSTDVCLARFWQVLLLLWKPGWLSLHRVDRRRDTALPERHARRSGSKIMF